MSIKNGFFAALLVVVASVLSGVLNAEEIRDYYDEPGLNSFKSTLKDMNEQIDPFSGTLQIKHVDIAIPGNGGLDDIVTCGERITNILGEKL